MKGIKNILMIVFKEDESESLQNFIKNSFLITDRFRARLSICCPFHQKEGIETLLSETNGKAIYPPTLCLQFPDESFREDVIKIVRHSTIDLVVLQYDPKQFHLNHFNPGMITGERHRFLETCPAPVLLLPIALRLNWILFSSIVVPMSGERKRSESLWMAIQIGNQLKLPIDLIHVSEDQQTLETQLNLIDQMSDEAHLEYPRLIEEFISAAIPFTGLRAKQCIRGISHSCGNAMEEIKNRMGGNEHSLLLLEWKGNIGKGHAKILKELLASAEYPILLVQSKHPAESTLKVGKKFKAA